MSDQVVAAAIAAVAAVVVAVITNNTRKTVQQKNALQETTDKWVTAVSDLLERVNLVERRAEALTGKVSDLEQIVAVERERGDRQERLIEHQESIILAMARLAKRLIRRLKDLGDSEPVVVPSELREYLQDAERYD